MLPSVFPNDFQSLKTSQKQVGVYELGSICIICAVNRVNMANRRWHYGTCRLRCLNKKSDDIVHVLPTSVSLVAFDAFYVLARNVQLVDSICVKFFVSCLHFSLLFHCVCDEVAVL